MNLNEKKRRKAAREERDEVLGNRMVVLMLLTFVAVFALAMCRAYQVHIQAGMALFIADGLLWVRLALGALFVASGIFFFSCRRKGADESKKVLSSGVLCALAGILFLASLLFPTILYAGLMVYFGGAFLLYLIYCIYQKDFFAFALLMVAGTLLIYLASLSLGAGTFRDALKIVCKVLAIVLPICAGALILYCYKHEGTVTIGGKKIRLMKENRSYVSLLTACAVLLLCAVLVLFFAGLLRYLLTLLLAVFLVFTIIYTVKLM